MMIKKYFYRLSVIVLFLVPRLYADTMNRSQASQYLVSIHNKVFGVDNLFKQKLMVQDWYTLTDKLDSYIDQNSKKAILGGLSSTKDAAIMKNLVKLRKANIDFVSTMQKLWGAYFSRPPLTSADFAKMQPDINQLNSIVSVVSQIQKDPALIKVTKDSKNQTNQNSAEILLQWAMFLEDTVKKAIRDFNKLKV